MRKHFWQLILAIVLVGTGCVLVAATPAVYAASAPSQTASVALTCSGSHCNGSDPYSTGCAGNSASYWVVDSVPVTFKGVSYGWLQLWWSQTCRTNWARYACSTSCRMLSLTLMICNADGSQTTVQAPISLHATGITKQQYLPTTRATAYILFQVSGTTYSGTQTGCY